jgi:hypothetical protein
MQVVSSQVVPVEAAYDSEVQRLEALESKREQLKALLDLLQIRAANIE